jgi:hypothetical protein
MPPQSEQETAPTSRAFSEYMHTFLSALKGGFYFHPTDEDLSVGTPAKEKAT